MVPRDGLRMKRDPWRVRPWVCVVPAGDVMACVCWRCHGVVRLCLPISLNELPRLMQAFSNGHSRCKTTLYTERRELTRALRRRAGLGRDGDVRAVEDPRGRLPWAYRTFSDFERSRKRD